MKNLFRAVFAVIFCAVLTGVTVNAQDALYVKELYQKMSENQRTLKSLKATLRQEIYNPQIKETDKKEGTILYVPTGARNANIRLDWTYPENEILSVLNGKYRLYRPRLQTVYEGTTKEASKQQAVGNSLSFINMTSAQLKQNFDAKWLGTELIAGDTVSTWRVKLTPKTPQNFSYAEVWVREDGMPVQFKVHEKNGDTNTVLLYNIERNAKINKNQIAVDIPKGTKSLKG